MAARYWVTGGTGTWSSTSNWSATSGGVSGATAPTTTDDAIFDTNSGTGSVTVTTTSILGWDTTNFGGTFTGSATFTINGGNVILGSGATFNNTGTVQVNTSGATFTSNGKTFNGVLLIATGFQPNGNITLNDNCRFLGIQHTVIAGTVNINGGNLILVQTSGTIVSSSSGRLFGGTSKFILAGTGSVVLGGAMSNDVDVNTSGTITQSGAVNIGGGATWKYYSGVWSAGVTAFQISTGGATLDLAGMPIYQLNLPSTATITLNSLLTVTNNILHNGNGTISTFAGAYGFTTPTLTTTASSTGRPIVLKDGVEYFVTGTLSMVAGASISKNSLSSSTPGVPAILTYTGNNMYLAQSNFYDIDASRGNTLWTYDGTISGSTNVFALSHSPTVIASIF